MNSAGTTQERTLVAIFTEMSQIDDPVFELMASLGSGMRAELIYWNDHGIRRTLPDPELGLTPVFPATDSSVPGLRRRWLDRRRTPRSAVVRAALEVSPSLVILNDLATVDKFAIAAHLRLAGTKVAFRSDKNDLSLRVSTGWKLRLERLAYRLAFDVFCPTSELSMSYYCWPRARDHLLFPYPTDAAKFSADGTVGPRAQLRARFHIPADAPLILAVSKFVPREGPIDVLSAFLELRERVPDAHLLLVGAGEQAAQIEAMTAEHGATAQVHLPGYVPFAELQDYFQAADVFVHLARQEPWGVSVSDALCAGLGVVTSDKVGAGLELLEGPLRRYVTPVGDASAAANAMEELVKSREARASFKPAQHRVIHSYSSQATARRLASFGA